MRRTSHETQVVYQQHILLGHESHRRSQAWQYRRPQSTQARVLRRPPKTSSEFMHLVAAQPACAYLCHALWSDPTPSDVCPQSANTRGGHRLERDADARGTGRRRRILVTAAAYARVASRPGKELVEARAYARRPIGHHHDRNVVGLTFDCVGERLGARVFHAQLVHARSAEVVPQAVGRDHKDVAWIEPTERHVRNRGCVRCVRVADDAAAPLPCCAVRRSRYGASTSQRSSTTAAIRRARPRHRCAASPRRWGM